VYLNIFSKISKGALIAAPEVAVPRPVESLHSLLHFHRFRSLSDLNAFHRGIHPRVGRFFAIWQVLRHIQREHEPVSSLTVGIDEINDIEGGASLH
jgi:hypothetical protein